MRDVQRLASLLGLTLAGILGALLTAYLLTQPSPVSAGIAPATLTELSEAFDTDVQGSNGDLYTLAASGSEVAASFGVTGAGTAITGVTLSSMTPQVASTLTITVSDSDTVEDTQTIQVILLFDAGDADPSDASFVSAGASGATAVDSKAVFTWTKASPFSDSTFVITSPASTQSTRFW